MRAPRVYRDPLSWQRLWYRKDVWLRREPWLLKSERLERSGRKAWSRRGVHRFDLGTKSPGAWGRRGSMHLAWE